MIDYTDRHLNEQLNRRSVYLRLAGKLWVIPVAMATGALLCFLLYTLITVTVHGQRQYRETAVYQVDFVQNEATGKAYDYYNAATWDGLIFTHPDIATTVRKELPEGMTMEAASEAVRADLVSDIRYLSVEVTTPDPKDTAQLSLAVRDGLENFGEVAKEFEDITFLSSDEPTLIVVSDRSRNAVLLGLFLGFIISAFALYLHEIMDDAIYVPEDAERRYGLPVLGVLAGKAGENRTVLPDYLQRQLAINLEQALREKERVLILSLHGMDDAKRILDELKATLSDTGAKVGGKSGMDTMSQGIRCGFVPTGSVDDPAFDRATSSCQDVIAAIHYGEGSGARTDNLLRELDKMDFHVIGLLLVDADGEFLSRYYKVTK